MHFLIASIISLFSSAAMMKPDSLHEQEIPIVTIGIVADAQYADADASGTRYYRASLHKLRESYDIFEKENVDFIINLGDIIDHGYDSFIPVLAIIDSSNRMTYHITGNHDYSVEDKSKGWLPVLRQNQKGYFATNKEGIAIIYLNGNDISTYAPADSAVIGTNKKYLDSLKSAIAINAMDWNGGIGKIQMQYLKKTLDYCLKHHNKVIIACHFPVFPENVHNLLNCKEVLDLIQKYDNVVAWFSGHNHAGNFGILNKTHFVTFRGMVETESENSFAIAYIFDDHIRIRGFGREESRILRY
ncbi:MAG TPA: metallophosphoesterase [Bacteroidales bacterium]|nr:metallophosphoesterase [Bacteroidales bacterium]